MFWAISALLLCVLAPLSVYSQDSTTIGPTQCSQNETFRPCSSLCEPTCANRMPACALMCGTPACQCHLGFYRNSTGQCVFDTDCEADTLETTTMLLDVTPLQSPTVTVFAPLMNETTSLDTQQPLLNTTTLYTPAVTVLPPFMNGTVMPPGMSQPPNPFWNGSTSHPMNMTNPAPVMGGNWSEPLNECSHVRCGDNTTCQLVVLNDCDGPQCDMRPQCVPTELASVCDRMRCGYPFQCMLVQHGCNGDGECTPEPQCILMGGPPPASNPDHPQHPGGPPVALNECSAIRCANDTTCSMVVLNSCDHGECVMKPQCVPRAIVDFCERLTCGDAYECRLVQHGCPDMASCQPEPQCFRKGDIISPSFPEFPPSPDCPPPDFPVFPPNAGGGHIALDDCSMFHCGDNATCQMVVLNNCEGGRCLMGAQCITQGLVESCEKIECGNSSQCMLVQHYCYGKEFCLPEPQCMPKNVVRPGNATAWPMMPGGGPEGSKFDCSTMMGCDTNNPCTMVLHNQCEGGRCDMRPQCLPAAVVRVCDRIRCTEGFECRIVQHGCRKGELCLPEPQCVSKGFVSSKLTDCSMLGCGESQECRMIAYYLAELDVWKQWPQCVEPSVANACQGFSCTEQMDCRLVLHQCMVNGLCLPEPQCVSKGLLPSENATQAPTPNATSPSPLCAQHVCLSDEDCVVVNGTATCVVRDMAAVNPCGEGEEYTTCMPSCQTTCRGVVECITGDKSCTAGCTCKEGYRRNGQKQCVQTKYCYLSPGCKSHETWSKCATCEKKCGNLDRNCITCYSGCGCDDGYARNSSSLCTLIAQCS